MSTENLINTDSHVLDQNINREMSGNNIISRITYHRHSIFLKKLLSNMLSHFEPTYLFFWGDANLRHSTSQVGLMYISMIIPFILGWFWLYKNKPRIGWFVLMSWLGALIPASVPTTVPHALRSLNALPLMLIVLGSGMHALFNIKKSKIILPATIVLIMLLELGLFWHDYWHHYPKRSASDWQYGYIQLQEYLRDNYHNYDKFIVSNIDDRMYLYTLFYNQIDPQLIKRSIPNMPKYKYKEFDKYIFDNLSSHQISSLEEGTMLVTSKEAYEHIKLPPKDILSNINGKPQFYIIDKFEI